MCQAGRRVAEFENDVETEKKKSAIGKRKAKSISARARSVSR